MSDELRGIVPGVPELFADPQVTSQPLFLPGTIEAEIEAEMERRGWPWHVVRVVAERKIALLIREADPDEEHGAACQMEYTGFVANAEKTE